MELLTDKLTDKLQEVRNVSNHRMEAERELTFLKNSNDKFVDAYEKQKKLREEITNYEIDRSKLLRRMEEQNIIIKDQSDQISKLNELIEKERNDRQKLALTIDALQNESDSIELNIKKAQDRENEFQKLVEQTENLGKKEHQLIKENEKLLLDLQKKESLIANGTKQVEHMTLQKNDLHREIKGLREELSILKLNDNELKTKSIKLQEKVNNYEILIADLRYDLSKAEKRALALEDELSQTKHELHREKSKIDQLTDDIKQLKTLCESLEKTRQELVNRLQNKNSEKNLEENEKTKLLDQINDLKKKLQTVEGDMKESKTSLVELDHERDQLQQLVDEKTEDYEKLRERFSIQEAELHGLKEKTCEYMALHDDYVFRIQELEGQIKELMKKNRMINEELSERRSTFGVNEVEIANLSQDLNTITRENQSLNEKMMSILEEKENLRDALGNVANQEKQARQALRATEMERDDILNNYKSVCLENERLKRNIDELAQDNQELFRKLKEVEKEIIFFRSQIQQIEAKEAQYLTELSSFERQITFLNKRLEEADLTIKENQEARQNLIKEFNNMRQFNDSIEINKDEYQKTVIVLEQEKICLQDQIRELKRNNDLLRQQFENEKNRLLQLEQILGNERQDQYRQNLAIQDNEQEKAELQNEIAHLQRRMQGK